MTRCGCTRSRDAQCEQIDDEIAGLEAAAETGGEYVRFALEDIIDNPIIDNPIIDNPIAIARVKATIAQQELAKCLIVDSH